MISYDIRNMILLLKLYLRAWILVGGFWCQCIWIRMVTRYAGYVMDQ